MTENTNPQDTGKAVSAKAQASAVRLDERIRKCLTVITAQYETLQELITKAQETEIHKLVTDSDGKPFATWQAYVTDVAKGLPPVRGKADRVAMIRFLLGADLSVRAVAEIADVSKSTVQNVKTETDDKPAESKGPGGKGAAQVHRKVTEKGAIKSVNNLTENVDDLESIDDLAELLTALGHAVKAVQARHDFLVKAREAARKSHPSSSEGNNPRGGTTQQAA